MFIEKMATVLKCDPAIFGGCETEKDVLLAFLEVSFLIIAIGEERALINFYRELEEKKLTADEKYIFLHAEVNSPRKSLERKPINWEVVKLFLPDDAIGRMQRQGLGITWGTYWAR